MTNFNFGRFFSFLLFLAFAGISAWATAESFHLSLDTWPKVLCWVMAAGFMVVASIGTKLIVDSLNQDIDVDNRGWQFVGGIILLLAFWIVCSMPTNTHTFFYRSDIHRVVNDDIATTEAYLQQLEGFTVNANYKTEKINNLKAQVELKLGELEGEIRNEANPGFGTKSKQILREFASLLDMPKMEQLSVGQNASRQQIVDAYRSKIYALRDAKIREIQNETEAAESSLFKNKAKEHLAELHNLRLVIDNGDLDLNVAEQVVEDYGNICVMRNGKTYSYTVAYKLLNSADFSVAQSRERLIYIAIRNDVVEERGITPQQIFDEIENANNGNKHYLLRHALEAIKPLDAPRVKNANEVDDEKTGKKIQVLT